MRQEGGKSSGVKYMSSPLLRSKIPVSNSVTAMELWLLACVILVFFSLLEYSVILWEGVKKRKASNMRLQVGPHLRQNGRNNNSFSMSFFLCQLTKTLIYLTRLPLILEICFIFLRRPNLGHSCVCRVQLVRKYNTKPLSGL